MRITLTGTRTADGEVEQILTRAVGTVSVTDGRTVLDYTEEGGALVTVTAEGGRLTMSRREGGITATLPMALFDAVPCDYQTAYGALAVTVTLRRLENAMTAAGGSLLLEYDLTIGGGVIRTAMQIEAE